MSARLLIAGTASGVGKTTITTGLIAAFRRRGLTVRSFKVGPDYIDPTYHALAAGSAGSNLDSWLVPHNRLRAGFAAATAEVDLAIIEGVMGLYDGAEYLDETGSTAEVAKLLAAPTILVLDVRAQARSAAAVALGFQQFDPAVPLSGVIANRVGGGTHGDGVRSTIERTVGLPVLGTLPRLDDGAIPARHLGLVRADEDESGAAIVAALADAVEHHCDLDALLALAQAAPPLATGAAPDPVSFTGQRPIIAYAHDAAFSFYYTENLDLLRQCGADLRPFSPLTNSALPPGTAAIYLGGGYPELHAAGLAANHPMLDALRTAIAAGMPCYAECGGLMYLTEGLRDLDGRLHPLVGALPGHAVMRERRSHLGYATVKALVDSPLLRAGETVRGHEFHYSTWEDAPHDMPHAYEVAPRRGGPARMEGFARGKLLASYVHLHFWTEPTLARRFVAAAATYTADREVANVVAR